MKFQKETFSKSFYDEIFPLLESHASEVSIFQGEPINPDFELYEFLNKHGSLRIFTARADEKLIGYSVFFVQSEHQFKTETAARQDLLFIEKAFRSKGLGVELIRFSDEELCKEKITRIYRSVSPLAMGLEKILTKLGYEHAETLFVRRI